MFSRLAARVKPRLARISRPTTKEYISQLLPSGNALADVLPLETREEIIAHCIENTFEIMIVNKSNYPYDRDELRLFSGKSRAEQLRELLPIQLSCKSLYFASLKHQSRILSSYGKGFTTLMSSLPPSEMVNALTIPKNGMPGFENTAFYLPGEDRIHEMPRFMKTKDFREQLRFLRFEICLPIGKQIGDEIGQSSMLSCVRSFRRLKEIILTLRVPNRHLNPKDMELVIAPLRDFEWQVQRELGAFADWAKVSPEWTVPEVKVMLNGAPFPITF